jgi:hypothetical protein
MEMVVTGQEKETTFMHRVVSPIYKMEDNDVNNLTKTLFFFLWAVVQYRLGRFDMFIDDFKLMMSGKTPK